MGMRCCEADLAGMLRQDKDGAGIAVAHQRLRFDELQDGVPDFSAACERGDLAHIATTRHCFQQEVPVRTGSKLQTKAVRRKQQTKPA